MQKTGEWGNFFNPSASPFPYNDTDAYERFPETKETIEAYGWKRVDQQATAFSGKEYTPLAIENYVIAEQQKELLTGVLVCEVTKKPFKIIKQEFDFYLKFLLPIPKKHPQQRYLERIQKWRLPKTLYERTCTKT
ncbi:MAG: hypothetical protein Q8O99_00960 [bacterium]|nr:hypothetical protein [bacterium]